MVRARNGGTIIDWSVPLAILFAIPIMIADRIRRWNAA
jgi:hypothetical protein